MEGPITRGLWLVAFLSGCGRLWAFNLDTENVLQKSGDPGSLFGFSIAMHRQVDPVDKRMLLVGAPQAKALKGQRSKVTGGLYSCNMSSTSAGCTRVIFDDNEDLTRESKENQWMGVTVNSQGPGGKVVTCAHRYQRRSNVGQKIETRDIIGRCYVLSQDLTINDYSGTDGDDWYFCDSRARGHEMFGSCQQGQSAIFDKDYHYIIFGAPGAYNWKGVVRAEQRNDTFIEKGIFDDGPYETGDEIEKNPEKVPAPPNSYLGFSLDTGKRLTKKGQLTVVAGAPRANHSGAVVLMKIEDTRNSLVDEYTLEGEGLASSFGYDLAVLDLNKDDWQDIVVGAPQYFVKDGEIGGAVYIYINKAGKWNKVTPTRIDGPKDSMFGLAVENLGDINQDGFHDFAVGAPYQSECDNGVSSGAVYIYHGSSTGQISQENAQVLCGKDSGVKAFGYSLAGNMDLDKNSYPDLAVGSLSDSAFVYRSRPVISIKKEITFEPDKIDLSNKKCGKNFCLTVKACFTYSANSKSNAPKLTLEYSLEADADFKKNGLNPRGTFSDTSASESHGTITMDGTKPECITRQLTILENIRDKLRGIPIDVSVKIKDSKRKRRQSGSPALSPVLDANEPMRIREEVHFLKQGCGKDNVCQSNLQVNYRYGFRTIDDDTFTPIQPVNGETVISLSDQKEIALAVKVSNPQGDDAHEASIVASFPRALTYSAFRATDSQVTCAANKDGSQAECELGNPFYKDSATSFYIILGTAGISLNTSEIEINLQLNTTSNQQLAPVKAKAKVAIVLQLTLSGQALPSQVHFSGQVKGESAIKNEKDIGSAIIHQFRVINLVKRLSDVGTATLNIDWPKEDENRKWLLYLMKISSTGLGGEKQIECSPKGEINPRGMKSTEAQTNTRQRRATESNEGTEGIISRLTEGRKSKTLSCDNGAKCVTIRCPLRGLDSNAVITLHSRLWGSTLIEDYSKLHHTEIIVKASLNFDSTTNTAVQDAVTEVKLTAYPERHEAQSGGVAWWIIVLSILLGLLLLGLLAFLLWKCGLFGKKKEDSPEKEKPTSNA
ncbi:integrin alpha-6-like [Pholidichthys leucotaenia]